MKESHEEKYRRLREKMVDEQIVGRGITDPLVVRAMRRVPRHLFVPEDLRHLAYKDTPLPIGANQTISQPYIVAYMTALLEIEPENTVLEVGTGSGYQTAVLAEIALQVYSVEIVPELYDQAKKRLRKLGYTNVHCHLGDGSLGWAEHAPYDRIIVTAAPVSVPSILLEQLRVGGIMVLPVGHIDQRLHRVEKLDEDHIEITKGPMVRFVPMTGIAEKLN